MTAVVKIGGLEVVASQSDIAQACIDLHTEHGVVEPGMLVDVASDPSHPLHKRFEWDDSVAGAAFRERQAADLIRTVRVTVVSEDRDPVRVRALVSKRDLGLTDGGAFQYVPIETVSGATALQASLRDRIGQDIQRMRRRYENYAVFLATLRDVVDELPDVEPPLEVAG